MKWLISGVIITILVLIVVYYFGWFNIDNQVGGYTPFRPALYSEESMKVFSDMFYRGNVVRIPVGYYHISQLGKINIGSLKLSKGLKCTIVLSGGKVINSKRDIPIFPGGYKIMTISIVRDKPQSN